MFLKGLSKVALKLIWPSNKSSLQLSNFWKFGILYVWSSCSCQNRSVIFEVQNYLIPVCAATSVCISFTDNIHLLCVLERKYLLMAKSWAIPKYQNCILTLRFVKNPCKPYGRKLVLWKSHCLQMCICIYQIFSAKCKFLFLFCRKFANLWCWRLSGVFVFMICSKQGPLLCSHFGLSGLKLER